jgi:hypothetical protein
MRDFIFMKTKLILLILSLLIVIGGIIIALKPHNSDLMMTVLFYKDKNKLNELVEMFNKDTQIGGIIGNYVSPSDFSIYPQPKKEALISDSRHNAYLDLLKEIGFFATIQRDHNNKELIRIQATYYSEEPDGDGAYSTSSKGYAYCPTEPSPIVSSFSDDKMEYSYKHLSGNWYIFYETGYGKPE